MYHDGYANQSFRIALSNNSVFIKIYIYIYSYTPRKRKETKNPGLHDSTSIMG